MGIRYNVLLGLQLNHNFFQSKIFEDFEMVPDANTKKLMDANRLIPKKSKNNWYLFFQSKGPWQTTSDSFINKDFTFELRITDDAFYSYTNNDFLPAVNNIEFFAETNDNAFSGASRFAEPEIFDYKIQHTERPVNVTLKKFKGEVIKDVTIVDPPTKSVQMDVSSNDTKAYDIRENTLPATTEKQRDVYIYPDFFKTPFYGVIHFKVFPVINENTNRYTLEFTKK